MSHEDLVIYWLYCLCDTSCGSKFLFIQCNWHLLDGLAHIHGPQRMQVNDFVDPLISISIFDFEWSFSTTIETTARKFATDFCGTSRMNSNYYINPLTCTLWLESPVCQSCPQFVSKCYYAIKQQETGWAGARWLANEDMIGKLDWRPHFWNTIHYNNVNTVVSSEKMQNKHKLEFEVDVLLQLLPVFTFKRHENAWVWHQSKLHGNSLMIVETTNIWWTQESDHWQIGNCHGSQWLLLW